MTRLAVAAGLLALALQSGGYALGVRNPIGIAIWWGVLMAAVVGLRPAARVPRAGVAAAALLAAFGALSGLSALWAQNAEGAVAELGRVTLYLGIFVAVAALARPGSAHRWADGLGAGIAAVACIALASRLLPGLGLNSSASQFFPGGFTYLSYPLEYWNGLAVLTGLGFPLLLRAAVAARSAALCGLALAPLPALVAVLYLSSSRGGALTALVATAAFVVASGRPLRAAAAASTALAGGAASVAALSTWPHLANGPFDGIAGEGRTAALLIALACSATGAAWWRLVGVRVALPRLARGGRRLVAGAAILVAAGAVVAADPAARIDAFTAPPLTRAEAAADRDADLTSAEHLTSSAGNGRWQFWSAAADQFTDRPLIGHGAGSYEAWWAQHGTLSYFTRQAHSLYLETLGELGLVGMALLGALLLIVAAAALRRLRGAHGDERTTLAAVTAAALGFALAAGIDWMWEMTVVGAVGIALLALVSGTATGPGTPAPRPSRALRAATAAAALVAIAALALPWLADREIRESRRATVAGEIGPALDAARRAEALTPWAASPRLQHALVHEAAGDLEAARTQIAQAIRRDGTGWRLWLVSARIEQAAGDDTAAADALRRARALNPRSTLLAGLR